MSRPKLPAPELVERSDVPPLEGSAPRRRDPSLDIELELATELQPVCHFAGYEVLGRLAVGGMAEVFLARERGEGGSARHVVLKVIRAQLASSPDLASMFLQEGKVALGLGHPNICHTLRFGTEHGRPFLAMELVLGVTLRDLFGRARRAGAPIDRTVAAKIISNVAEALHSAHVARDERGRKLGIVHQDVSPQNVMVAFDGTVKLLDFGVASTSTERAIEPVESSQVTVRGKTAYLSPEQCSGVAVDARSDVFSLGIVLYEMLTGARLFARAQSLDAMRAIAVEPLPEWPSSIPAGLRQVLDRALAQNREERYATAAAMQEDLEHYLVDDRRVVTSSTIAREIKRLLGDDFGKAPTIDASSEGVAWLRSEAETICAPIPLTKRRKATSPARTVLMTLGVVATLGASAAAVYWMQSSTDVPARVSPATVETPLAEASLTEDVPSAPVAVVPAAIEEVIAPPPEPVVEAPTEPHRSRSRGRRPEAAAVDTPSDFIDDPGF